MRLVSFQSGKGDCLLLSNSTGQARILIDGGVPTAYTNHVASAVGALRKQGKSLDLVYISHIDQDHIGGVLRMLDDEMAWQVHDYQKSHGNPKHKVPEAPRPPKIGKIWHNAFHDQVPKNTGDIQDALAAAAVIQSPVPTASMQKLVALQSGLVASISEAIRVSRRVSPEQLNIHLNPDSDGKMMMFRQGQPPIVLGGMRITILGPLPVHLTRLRKEWNAWLSKHQEAVKKLRETARRDTERLGNSELGRLLASLALQAEVFGNPESVTPPNLASLTLLVEEGGQSILLTGDARGDQIIDGLAATNRLAAGQRFRVDVLKVPHHGSENNIDKAFCDRVVASHYVFCGNGEHENPDLRVVELIAKRRLLSDNTNFKFWFNSSHQVSEKEAAAEHMSDVESLVRRLAKASHGRMTFKFLTSGSSINVS